jgi:hypothetical protein
MNLYSLPYRKSAEQRNKHRFSLLNQSFSLFRSAEQIGTECGTAEQIGHILETFRFYGVLAIHILETFRFYADINAGTF